MDDSDLPEIPVRLKRGNKPRESVDPSDVVGLLTQNTRVKLAFSFSPVWFKRLGPKYQSFGVFLVAQALEIFPFERTMHVIPTESFDANELVFPETTKNSYGSPNTRIAYGASNRRVQMTTGWAPMMGSRMGNGIEFFPDTPNKPYIRLRFEDTHAEETVHLIDALKSIEESVKGLAKDRADEWFSKKKNISPEDIGDYFNPVLRQIGDNKGEPIDASEPYYVKFKLPLSYSDAPVATDELPTNYRTVFKDRNGEVIDGATVNEFLQRGMRARVTFQTCPVFVMQSANYGVPLEAVVVEVDGDVKQFLENGRTNQAGTQSHNNLANLFDDDEDDLAVAAHMNDTDEE